MAEEGLDIGSVNLIVSYDCLSSPIRMIQRFGRTGRMNAGYVIVLVTRGEEEKRVAQSRKHGEEIMQALKGSQRGLDDPPALRG